MAEQEGMAEQLYMDGEVGGGFSDSEESDLSSHVHEEDESEQEQDAREEQQYFQLWGGMVVVKQFCEGIRVGKGGTRQGRRHVGKHMRRQGAHKSRAIGTGGRAGIGRAHGCSQPIIGNGIVA